MQYFSDIRSDFRIMLLEGVSNTAVDALNKAGYRNIDQVPSALEGPELANALKNVQVLGIRSRTKLTAAILHGAKELIAIGCFAVGTNQVDVGYLSVLEERVRRRPDCWPWRSIG